MHHLPFTMRRSFGIAAAAVITLGSAVLPIVADAASTPSPLHVRGNQVLDRHNNPVWLQGVDIPSLEWSINGDHMLQSVQEATGVWHANIIRVPLSEDSWFGKNVAGNAVTDGGAAYRALVHQVVKTAAGNGAYTILDMHWNDRDQWGQDIGQHKMPDQHTILFWKSLAAAYANAPSVLFDLYNEPHDVSGEIWRNGGSVTDHSTSDGHGSIPDVTYQAAGLQQLVDAVRSVGAKNVIVAGQLDWAYSTKEVTQGGPLSDAGGHGIIYANHAYPFKGESVNDWDKRLTAFSAKYPVIVSEFGSDESGGQGETGAQWIQDVLSRIQAHHWNWTAWSFHTGAHPIVISDWNYTPTSHFGVYVKEALAGEKISPPQKTSSAAAP